MGETRDQWDQQMDEGMAFLSSGAFDSAAKTFAQVRERAPRQLSRTIATNNLAWTDLMIDTPASAAEALPLANEALQAMDVEPQKETFVGMVKGTLAFALIKNDQVSAGLALIDEVLAEGSRGATIFALRLCVRAIGLARAGDLLGARALVSQVRKADPQCQLLTQAIDAIVGPTIVVPPELLGLAPMVERYGISDDAERERVLNVASTEELTALVNRVTNETLTQINEFLDTTFDAEVAVPFGDLAQAAIEARLELQRRER